MYSEINRNDRDDLSALIRRYLNEELSAYQFDEALDTACESADPTVRYVASQVWYFYDDCEDHLVAVDKPIWDYHQRLMLLLESDFTINETKSFHWCWTQLVAATALLGFFFFIKQFGWGEQALLFAIPFGFVSIAISQIRESTRASRPYDEIVHPFRSIGELRTAYVKTLAFRKSRYPRHLSDRQMRSPFSEGLLWFQHYLRWLLFSPIPLAFQTLPLWLSRIRALPPCSP